MHSHEPARERRVASIYRLDDAGVLARQTSGGLTTGKAENRQARERFETLQQTVDHRVRQLCREQQMKVAGMADQQRFIAGLACLVFLDEMGAQARYLRLGVIPR